jgi:hypothetical protein
MVEEIAVKYGLNAQAIGSTTSGQFTIRIDGSPVIEGEASAFKESWRQALELALQGDPAIVRA